MESSFKGILYPARLPTFHRRPAPAPVADLVQWFWIPEWNIGPGRTSRQQLIAYPGSNLVVQPDGVVYSGPTTRASYRDLAGRGWAVGALLRPAAVPLFTDDPASLRDTELAVAAEGLHLSVAEAMDTHDGDARRERAVDALVLWLASLAGTGVSEEALLANRLMDVIGSDASVVRVEDAASALAVSQRTLQRVARKYIGLSPAALIRRRRLQDAAERTRQDPSADLAAIAAELGYADHAHLTNDFQKYLGFTPSAYRRAAAGDADSGRI
ncbi:helix-turn-helix domain-containing protein [Arthrobacter sp. FW305-BF8]|uniref:AraC family transcriptional regulator n=1 Tax=Arthrobacter sp. FW305-BF8 TaxID=2879617 RepID=UPI001F2C600F|nr:helix-turn-helix domain-containing protein [Arthrobacter sp. FW305-BF8]UKA53489.1 helix-turn-helix domain-containing protein [Arthrobacter sp. FW305-BF8]